MSATFLKESLILVVAGDAVMYERRYNILCKVLFIKNLLILEICYKFKVRAFQKKNKYHAIYHIIQDVAEYCHLSTYTKEKILHSQDNGKVSEI